MEKKRVLYDTNDLYPIPPISNQEVFGKSIIHMKRSSSTPYSAQVETPCISVQLITDIKMTCCVFINMHLTFRKYRPFKYTVHKKFSTTRTCCVILLLKIIYQNKIIIWLRNSARYDVNHSFLSSGVYPYGIDLCKKYTLSILFCCLKCTSDKIENSKRA